MTISLSNLLTRKKPLADLLRQAAAWTPDIWCIEDPSGQVIFGDPPEESAQTCPICLGTEMLGQVKSAGSAAPFIAAWLENWLRQEAEKKQLGAETLHMYREINLIFSFSEKLAATLGAEAIARLTLQEAGRIIGFGEGWVFLWDNEQGIHQLLASSGHPSTEKNNPAFFQNLIQNGQSEIIAAPDDTTRMILYTSLCIGQRILGAVVLQGAAFSAADLKLLSTLSALAAAVLEHSIQYERVTAQALKEQREQLTLEIALKNPFFKKLMAVVEARYQDPEFSVAALSEALHLSVSQLQRKIASMTDLTPVQIIRDLRLNRAKDLLRTTDLNVSEIAFQSGFNDPSYFTRLFVRELHCAPSEWREK